MSTDLDLSKLSEAEKDALILTLQARLDEAHKLIAELRVQIDELTGPRQGSLCRQGGGRALTAELDEVLIAMPARCRHCQAAFADADQTLPIAESEPRKTER